MTRRHLALLLLLMWPLFKGCASVAPPSSTRLELRPSVAADKRVLLLIDVCINYSPLGSADYFLVAPSRAGGQALTEAVERHLLASGVKVNIKLVPFACGALHDAANVPKRIAESIDSAITTSPQPIWLSPEIAADPELASALQVLATHSFEEALASVSPARSDVPQASSRRATSIERVAPSADLVARHFQADTLIYVGVTATSNSTAKAATIGTLQALASIAVSVAIGPVFTAGGSQYGVVFVPGGVRDVRQMVATTLNLQSATTSFSNVVSGGGDPLKLENLVQPQAISLLLRDQTFKNADQPISR